LPSQQAVTLVTEATSPVIPGILPRVLAAFTVWPRNIRRYS